MRDNLDKDEFTKIEYEQLRINDKVVVNRNTNGIVFNDKPTLKLSPHESILKLFQEEEQIKSSFEGFNNVYFADHRYSANPSLTFSTYDDLRFLEFKESLTQQPECSDRLALIRKSNFPMATRLFLAQQHNKETFDLIQDRFISIFPLVTGIKSDLLNENDYDIPPYLKDCLFIQILEQGVRHWI
jgi:hypothetical protein